MKYTGLDTIGVYITCRQNTMVKYIATGTIFDILVTEECMTSSPELLRWWEQAGVQFGDGRKAEVEGGYLDLGYWPRW